MIPYLVLLVMTYGAGWLFGRDKGLEYGGEIALRNVRLRIRLWSTPDESLDLVDMTHEQLFAMQDYKGPMLDLKTGHDCLLVGPENNAYSVDVTRGEKSRGACTAKKAGSCTGSMVPARSTARARPKVSV